VNNISQEITQSETEKQHIFANLTISLVQTAITIIYLRAAART
jgi:hypothetical protein